MTEKPYKIYEGKISELFPENAPYSFLVGAGISMDSPSNAPSARSVVRALLECCALEDEVEALLEYDVLRYEYIIELIQRHFDEHLVIMQYFDLITEPNLNHLFLANALLKKHLVITTNFDYLIEYGFKKVNSNDISPLFPLIKKTDFLANPY
ncbi:MAG: hypothetical protein ACFFBD_26905, partial [Candidatus Hodarchaeota archaeon]